MRRGVHACGHAHKEERTKPPTLTHRSGPGGRCHFLAGRDGSRTLATGCFDASDEQCTQNSASLEGLTTGQVRAVDDWLQYLMEKYTVVGKLDVPKGQHGQGAAPLEAAGE